MKNIKTHSFKEYKEIENTDCIGKGKVDADFILTSTLKTK
jgi:hypothetical protein